MDEAMKALAKRLDSLLGSTDTAEVTSESTGFSNLPDGFYLCEVEKAELKTSKKGDPMVAFQFKAIENGIDAKVEETGKITAKDIPKTKNRKIFNFYVLKDEDGVKRFVGDMLKFEGETPGEPLLTKEYFISSDVLEDALDILGGMRIYIQISTSVNKSSGESSTWNNLISWKKAAGMELPI